MGIRRGAPFGHCFDKLRCWRQRSSSSLSSSCTDFFRGSLIFSSNGSSDTGFTSSFANVIVRECERQLDRVVQWELAAIICQRTSISRSSQVSTNTIGLMKEKRRNVSIVGCSTRRESRRNRQSHSWENSPCFKKKADSTRMNVQQRH